MTSHPHDPANSTSGFPALGSSEAQFGLEADCTPGSGSGSLMTRLVDEMVAAWRRGEHAKAEAFLDRHPELSAESALRLIHEEVSLRQEAGLEVDPAEVVNRFPKWRAELEVLLDCQRLIQAQGTAITFPEEGEVLGGFRLLAVLGRGASGRIFLALQNSLASRPVVLKVTTCGQEEHLALARLQHMNIVPLYSEQVLRPGNQRILCMPYLGGATLARLLELLRDCPPPRRSGKRLIEALDQAQEALPVSFSNQGPYRVTLARSPYVQAIAWIGACLADGLGYAHDRGLVHMDIKPSNVLLTGDGQPMLLDFHLARGVIDPAGPHPPRLGGTTDYASPEQLAAMASIRQGRPIRFPVDGRSDIYSLGVLLYEALGGSKPRRGKAVARPATEPPQSPGVRRTVGHYPEVSQFRRPRPLPNSGGFGKRPAAALESLAASGRAKSKSDRELAQVAAAETLGASPPGVSCAVGLRGDRAGRADAGRLSPAGPRIGRGAEQEPCLSGWRAVRPR